jgi:cytochrome c-type biogenesis protein
LDCIARGDKVRFIVIVWLYLVFVREHIERFLITSSLQTDQKQEDTVITVATMIDRHKSAQHHVVEGSCSRQRRMTKFIHHNWTETDHYALVRILIVLTMAALLLCPSSAFQQSRSGNLLLLLPSSQLKRRTNVGGDYSRTIPASSSTRSSLKKSELAMGSWEDMMFNAQSTASSMATISLDDPTNLMSSIPVMYGAGLLTAFSPCVWGLLPLTISYISTAAGERKDKGTTLPTLCFAAGLASVFCTLGLIAASVGGAVYGNSGNTSIVLPIISNAICCIMGFQLLELIELPLPSLQPVAGTSRGAGSTNKRGDNNQDLILIDGSGKILSSSKGSSSTNSENGSLFRTFLLGGTSALVASPCATPVLTSILAFVASSPSPLLGGFLLMFYTLGYSTPLLVTAATGGQALVRLKELGGKDDTSISARIAPWVTPFTAGVLLWYGTSGLLTTILGDPSLSGLLTLG